MIKSAEQLGAASGAVRGRDISPFHRILPGKHPKPTYALAQVSTALSTHSCRSNATIEFEVLQGDGMY